MQKRVIPTIVIVLYSVFLITVLVFKNIPVLKIGHLMFRFGGTDTGPANFVPFKTILSYLLGEKGWLITTLNLGGNIALLIPIGLLAPFLYRTMTWRQSLILAISIPFVIELTQVVLKVGRFDVDDVILNGAGVMIGYGVWRIVVSGMRHRGETKV